MSRYCYRPNLRTLQGLFLGCSAAITAACGGTSSVTTNSAAATAGSQTGSTTSETTPMPQDIKAAAGNGQVKLTWSAVSTAISYNVMRASNNAGPYTQIATPTSNWYIDTTVVNGATFYYVVSTVGADGDSASSAPISAAPEAQAPTPTAPSTPANLTAAAGNAQVTLSWTATANATGYNVKRATTSGGPYTQIAAPADASYTDASLTNGTTYYYVVSAVDEAGESANSTEVSAAPVAPAPTLMVTSAPMGLTATSGNAQVTLGWTATANATGYNVKRATTSGGPYTQIAAPTGASYTDASLTNGTTYYYVVSAVDQAGESANSAEVSAAPVAPAPTLTVPSAPMGLAATAGNAQVTLSWTATANATGYYVKRATTSGGPYTQIAAPSGPTYADSSLSNGTTYFYVVSALDSAGEGANSAQAQATPAAPSSGGGAPTGPAFNFTAAPTLSGITMVQNRDSVIVQFPAVANARDFRVLVQPTAVSANSNGTETVTGGTQFCAGVQQHQTRTRYVADKVTQFPYYFNVSGGEVNPLTFVPQFASPPPGAYGIYDLDTPPVLQVEVTGVTAAMTVTVEAIDRLCPFPGIIGRRAQDIALIHNGDTDHPGNPWIDASAINSFPVVTKAMVIAKYGSLIVNGQGWAGGPNVQANPPSAPPFGQQAPLNPPVVLARGAITISPLASPPAPLSGFFDDFSNSNDTFQPIPLPQWTYPRWTGGQLIMQNSKWTVYGNGFTCCSPTAAADNNGYADAYVDNGVMNTILSDWGHDGMSEISLFPRTAAHLNSSTYLHVTYEVPSYATSRRYWVFTACGSSTPGQTLDSTGALKEQVAHTTFFYMSTGASPSTAGWNCLQIFNRQGSSNSLNQWGMMYNLNGSRPPVPANKGGYDLADYLFTAIPSISNPAQTAAYTVHPESDVLVMVNKPIPAANLPEVLGDNQQVAQSSATSPINVSPMQLDNPAGEIAWFYRVDANGNPVAPILDDQQLASPRTKYDLYIRNNRIIMYVNGQARLCNDFTTPTTALNMADVALGFHQVLYHSSGEFVERFNDPDRGAAYHYRYNSPWIDQRSWDNVGFQENTAPPSDFNPATCFVHKSLGPENNEP